MTRILLDIDGVLADLVTHLRTEAGITSEVNTMDFRDCLTDLELLQVEVLSKKRGFCRAIPWYPGAKDFLKDLQCLGRVYAVTAPWRADTWAHERREWLAGHIHENHVLSVPTGAKHMVSGDILIEDNPETIGDWLHGNPRGHAILIDRPYNQVATYSSRVYRAVTYGQAIQLVQGICLVYT